MEKEINYSRNVWLLTIAMFFLAGGYTMIIPFLPVYLIEIGTPMSAVPLWSGAVFSIAFFIGGVMAPIWGRMSDRKGRKLMVLRAGLALGVTYILGGFVQDPWQLFGVRALQGFANGFFPAAITLISTSVPEAELGKFLGIFQTGTILGQVMGPLLGGIFASLIGMREAFFVVGGIVILINLLIALWVQEPYKTTVDEGEETTTVVGDLKLAWHNKKLFELLVLTFLVQAAILLLQPIITLYVGDLIQSISHAGLISGIILSISGVVGAIMASYWARYGQRTDYFRAVLFGFIGTGMSVFLQGIFQEIWTFAILQIIINFFGVGINPSLSALVTLNTKAENRGRAYGLMTTAQQFGSMAGPLMASIVSTYFGIPAVFLVTGLFLLIVAFYVWKKHKNYMFGTVKVV